MNLNQVTLPVKHINEANEFYLKLGFTQIVKSANYSRFSCPDGDSTFSLSLNSNNFENHSVIYFEHEDLNEWVKELQTRGIKFDQEPRDESYLWREVVLHDPSGNKIKLFWAGENRLNPPWRVEISR